MNDKIILVKTFLQKMKKIIFKKQLLEEEKLKTKWKIKKIKFITYLLSAVLLILLYIFFFSNSKLSYLKSPQCPSWEIMNSWEEYPNWVVKVISCTRPYSCPIGKELKPSCWVFADRTSCWLICLWKNEYWPILKPVIYLYPENKTDIMVKLDYKWAIIADYPNYDTNIKWWNVTANHDSTIINKKDNKEYNYLFWEWMPNEKIDWNIDKWFVVKWTETREFLQEILPKIWLTPKEYNEFIVYWYPILQNNTYNLIHFSWKQYTDLAPLETTPNYDSILRVFMVIKPLEKPIKIEPQVFKKFDRKWFTVVEWWWTVIK